MSNSQSLFTHPSHLRFQHWNRTMTAFVDYGAGNIRSDVRVFERMGERVSDAESVDISLIGMTCASRLKDMSVIIRETGIPDVAAGTLFLFIRRSRTVLVN